MWSKYLQYCLHAPFNRFILRSYEQSTWAYLCILCFSSWHWLGRLGLYSLLSVIQDSAEASYTLATKSTSILSHCQVDKIHRLRVDSAATKSTVRSILSPIRSTRYGPHSQLSQRRQRNDVTCFIQVNTITVNSRLCTCYCYFITFKISNHRHLNLTSYYRPSY